MDTRRTDALGWTLNLAIFRIVFLAYAVLPFARYVSTWTSHVMPGLPPSVWQPISFYRYIPPAVLMNAGLAHWLAVANVVMIILALAGAWTRYTLGVATVLSTYVFGLMENQGKVDHFHHLVWFMALLAGGPSGHLLSIDAIVRAIRRADRGLIEPEVSSFAALWTLRYTWALLGLLYLVPGLAKLQAVLVSHWATAENLRRLMWVRWFELALYKPHFSMPVRVDHLPPRILEAFGWGAILFEVGFIALVLWRPTRWLAAVSGFVFHTVNEFVLGIYLFLSLKVAYVSLVDWSAFGRSFATRRRQQPLLVLYDGECQLCRRTIAVLRTIDLSRALEPVAAPSDDARRRQHPGITDEMLIRDLHVIREGRPLRGYEAYVAIAARMPLLWPFFLIMRLPPVSAIGSAVYRRVADARRCPIAPHQPAVARSGRTRSGGIHYVGAFLVIVQTFVSLANFSAGMRFSFFPRPVRAPIKAGLAEFASQRLVWPFDAYPSFAYIYGASSEIWEARVVFADGREMRVTAEAYATFCRPAVCRVISRRLLEETDPIRHRKRSLEIVRHLWKYEAARVGADAVGVRVYHARYETDPSVTRPLEQRLMYEFPIAILSSTVVTRASRHTSS